MDHKENGVVLLEAGNFTPPSRTPWGGERIAALKSRWVAGRQVGESWELSVEPSFPSRCEPEGALLSEVLASDRERWLGEGDAALLVKLIDAADDLSVQIHPEDGYAALAKDESGKPESWYVVARERGSGIYFGLRDGVDRERMVQAIDGGQDVSALLFFVEVEVGDFFLIEPGTAHCIGRGVMLVEPQRVSPGQRAVTYRYWDWNRRYDAEGKLDEEGEPRPLHREHALAVTAFDAPREQELLARARERAGAAKVDGAAQIEALAGEGALASDQLRVARVCGSGRIELPDWRRLRAITVLEGRASVGDLLIEAGRTAAIAAGWKGSLALDRAHAIVSAALS